jgi:predicted Zn-dependent protease
MKPLRLAPVALVLLVGCPSPDPGRSGAAGAPSGSARPVAGGELEARAALRKAREVLDLGLDPAGALANAKVAAAGLPADLEARRTLAQALEETGDLDGAKAAYAAAVKLAPTLALRRKLASLEARHGDPARAIEAWEALRDEDPKDLSAHLELGELFEKAGRPASAEAELREVALLAPDHPVLLRRLAEFLEREGKLAEARAARARADELAGAGSRRMRELPDSPR